MFGLCEVGVLGLCAVGAGRLCVVGVGAGRRSWARWAAGAVRGSRERLFDRAGCGYASELGDGMLGLCDRGYCGAVALGAGEL
ncbi:hypothetical protein ACOSQ3_019808 [Xanthoceras sorbifolium]